MKKPIELRVVLHPQPKHMVIEGLAHVTIGMDPADDGAVWYDADCISPGREVEQASRFNSRKINDGSRFELVLSGVVGKRLTYRRLCAIGDAGFMGIK